MKKGKYITLGADRNSDVIIELWWVQGPMTKPKRIRIKPSTGTRRYKKDGKEMSQGLPWGFAGNCYYDLESAIVGHKKMKKAIAVDVLWEAQVAFQHAQQYMANFDPTDTEDSAAIGRAMEKLATRLNNKGL
ncbi:MAG: hypothetical protein KAH32_06380 [Chlamydiia bacterium]|nr:hypothetical protein [Chlamydiia bacterium]